MAAAAKVTAAGRPSPVQTRLKYAKFPDQHGHIYSPAAAAETALTRSNDGQLGNARRHMISHRNDNGAWLNAAEDHALALATPAHSPGWTVS